MSDNSEEPRPGRNRFNAEEARKQAEAARQKAEIIFSRAYGLFRDPRGEWEQIRAEETNVPSILLGYVAPLAAVPPVFGSLGTLIFGTSYGGQIVRSDPGTVLLGAVVTFLASVALVYFMGILINVIVENFEGEKDDLAAQKVAAYAMTPTFMAGFFSIWPPVSLYAGLIGIAMTAFLLYRGLPPLMKCPPERAQGFTVTVMIAGLVAVIVLFSLSYCVTGAGTLSRASGVS